MSELQIIWYFLIGLLLTMYIILDGYDLGTGVWHLFQKKEEDRQFFLKAIGPLWDGNEVWLLTGGGALFAAFPLAYASVFSGFYLAVILLLLGLIFRAVAIEVRNFESSPKWRKNWDIAFSFGSILVTLLLGVALGNILRGLPFDNNMNYVGSFFSLLNPFALLVGITGLLIVAVHGALFILAKSEGDLKDALLKKTSLALNLFIVFLILTSVVVFIWQSHLLRNYFNYWFLWVFPVITLGFIILTKIKLNSEKFLSAFLFSSLSIFSVMAVTGISIFPEIVPALYPNGNSISIANASSSNLTLKTMLIIALIGMPFVFGYTIWIQRKFWKKTY
jgi:cytochrome d ubiquinol oxidase subunit II